MYSIFELIRVAEAAKLNLCFFSWGEGMEVEGGGPVMRH